MMKADSAKARYIRFGHFTFATESDELFRDQQPVPLQPKPARLLGFFLSRPGRLVTQEEIVDAIWSDSVVDYEQRIRSAVKDIRAALGDDAESPSYLETVSRRGYRFIYPLESAPRGSARRSQWLVAAAVLVAILSFAFVERGGSSGTGGELRPVVLAVLPVHDVVASIRGSSPAPGLTHELIAGAAQLAPESLIVIGRASATKFEDSTLSATEIAAQLGADYLLETTLGGEEGVIRLTVTLAAADSHRVVWSSKFEGSEDRLQEFERGILAGIEKSLLGERSSPPASSLRHQTNARAYDAYLSGLYFLEQVPLEKRSQSYTYFQEAIDLDPEFASAYVGLARAGRATGRPDDEFWVAMDEALRLDETLAEPYYYRAAHAFMQEWDWEAAGRDFERAVRLDPGRSDFHAFYSAFLRASGDLERAAEESNRALTIDPLSEFAFRDMTWLYLDIGDYERAIEHCQRALRLGLENPSQDHRCLTYAYLQLDDPTNAAKHAREMMTLDGADDAVMAEIQELSPSDQISAYWNWSLDTLTSVTPDKMPHIRRAMALSALGRTGEALDSLERSLEAREPPLVFIMGDVLLAPLHHEPRFQAVVRAVGIPRAVN